MKLQAYQYLFLGVTIVMVVVKVNTRLMVKLKGDIRVWDGDGCILRKSVIPANESDPCYHCTMNPTPSARMREDSFNQQYISCTAFCEFVTVCTEQKYYTILPNERDPTYIPVCYQCENRKDEDVFFERIGDNALCARECAVCAAHRDILRASECAKQCQGLPTFCYPLKFWYSQLQCYRATFWYGCLFQEKSPDIVISNTCKECAKVVTGSKDAQRCAIECDGLPTYEKNGSFLQCAQRPHAATGDFFYYDLPDFLIQFMHVSKPGNIYPMRALERLYLSSFVGKRIFRKFNISMMTWPRPPGYDSFTSA